MNLVKLAQENHTFEEEIKLFKWACNELRKHAAKKTENTPARPVHCGTENSNQPVQSPSRDNE